MNRIKHMKNFPCGTETKKVKIYKVLYDRDYNLFFRLACGQKMSFVKGGVHKLRLQEEGGRWSKNRLFVNFYTMENVNGVDGQKKPNFVNVVCERP